MAKPQYGPVNKKTVPDILPPHNVEAEEAVLGSLLIDPDAMMRVSSLLRPADFFVERHAWIYEACANLFNGNTPIDLITLTDKLNKAGRLDEAGGSAFLTGLINATPTAIHAEYYARIVEGTAKLRNIINAAGTVARLAHDETQDVHETINKCAVTMAEALTTEKANSTKPVSASLQETTNIVEELHKNGGQLRGVTTGLVDLDRILKGLKAPRVYILAGRPGMGKTLLALKMLVSAGLAGDPVGMCSLEMNEHELNLRMVSQVSGIDHERLQDGDIKDDEWGRYISACNRLAAAPIYVNDKGGLTLHDLRTIATDMKMRYGIKVLFVDYVQLMQGSNDRDGRQQELTKISQGIKTLAKDLNIAVVLLSQLNRDCESRKDKRPMLSDLRETGSLEQDCDVALFVYRDEVYYPDETEYPNIMEILNLKNRHGKAKGTSVYFRGATQDLANLEVRVQNLTTYP